MSDWIKCVDRFPQVNQITQFARESEPVLVKDENGNHSVCIYENEVDGSNGGWRLSVQRFAKIGFAPDIIMGFDVFEWRPIQ